MRRYTGLVGNTNTKGVAEPYTMAEASATVREAFNRSAREPWGPKRLYSRITPSVALATAQEAEPLVVPDLMHFLHNDHGNACRLNALSGNNIRYCRPFEWLVWDGMRWALDETCEVRRLAKNAMLEFLRQAIDAKIEAAEKFANGSLDARRIAGAIFRWPSPS